jgi:hypothetical protein
VSVSAWFAPKVFRGRRLYISHICLHTRQKRLYTPRHMNTFWVCHRHEPRASSISALQSAFLRFVPDQWFQVWADSERGEDARGLGNTITAVVFFPVRVKMRRSKLHILADKRAGRATGQCRSPRLPPRDLWIQTNTWSCNQWFSQEDRDASARSYTTGGPSALGVLNESLD